MIKRFKPKQQKVFYRINDRITASSIRVLDNSGKQIGVLSRTEALEKARQSKLDLVEIAPKARPPVAKIVDFNKFLYQQEKKKREERKKSKVSETKEVRLGPFMNDHDLGVMIRRSRDFLNNGDKVKLVVRFSGRQIVHPEFGQKILEKVIAELSEVSKVEKEKHFEGKQLISILTPFKAADKGKTKKQNEGKTDENENKKINK